jgi:hypothetical protein
LSAEKDRLEMSVPDEARREVETLVSRFQRNRDVYTRPDYKETQVRVEFIDPFFEATDAEIDALGCGLYALTEEEIAIVEGRE